MGFQVFPPAIRVDKRTVGQAPSHHVDAKISPGEIILDRYVGSALNFKIAVMGPDWSFPAGKRDVHRRSVYGELYDPEARAYKLSATALAKAFDDVAEL